MNNHEDQPEESRFQTLGVSHTAIEVNYSGEYAKAHNPYEHPAIVLRDENGGELVLHYMNTKIRTFSDPFYDHIEIRTEEGLKAYREPELANWLLESNYPFSFEPIVDDASYEWRIMMESRLGAMAIDRFLKEVDDGEEQQD